MLGEVIRDPEHIESRRSQVRGLGLLPVTTTFAAVKSTHQVKGHVAVGRGLLADALDLPVAGYEIHMGQTTGEGIMHVFLIEEKSRKPCLESDGVLDEVGNVLGTYIHGLFHNEALRRSILARLATKKGVRLDLSNTVCSKEAEYDKLAYVFRKSLDMGLIYQIIGLDE
jgi:adenosylcobyric acid synthase